MEVLRVTVYGLFNSFREPLTQRYQKSLPLPPVTTMAGFWGASLGFSFEETVERIIKKMGLSVVRVRSCGGGYDLWRYRKEVRKGIITNTDVVLREFYYLSTYNLYLFGEELKEFESAVKNPVFAQTLGNADELVHVELSSVRRFTIEKKSISSLRNTIVPSDLRGRYQIQKKDISLTEFYRNLQVPLVHYLPVLFDVKKNGREASVYDYFTFVGETPIELSEPIEGVKIDDYNIIPCGPYTWSY